MILHDTCDAPACKERLEFYHAADIRLYQWAAETFGWRYIHNGWPFRVRIDSRPPRVWS